MNKSIQHRNQPISKLKEGVFGEVFLNGTHVLKIIPIEGDFEINGAQQKRFDEILQEVIISQELGALRYCDKNRTTGFVEVLNVRFVEGPYPAHLLDLWDDFDIRQVSENDRPDVFGDNQLYVVFELANCGSDIEAHTFKNAEQSYSAFRQVIENKHSTIHKYNLEYPSLKEYPKKFKFCCSPYNSARSFCDISCFRSYICCFFFWFLRRVSVGLVHNEFATFMTRFTLIHCINCLPISFG